MSISAAHVAGSYFIGQGSFGVFVGGMSEDLGVLSLTEVKEKGLTASLGQEWEAALQCAYWFPPLQPCPSLTPSLQPLMRSSSLLGTCKSSSLPLSWYSCEAALHSKLLFIYLLTYLLNGRTVWHAGSLFPDQGSNPCPLHWKRGVHWMAREVPIASLHPIRLHSVSP